MMDAESLRALTFRQLCVLLFMCIREFLARFDITYTCTNPFTVCWADDITMRPDSISDRCIAFTNAPADDHEVPEPAASTAASSNAPAHTEPAPEIPSPHTPDPARICQHKCSVCPQKCYDESIHEVHFCWRHRPWRYRPY